MTVDFNALPADHTVFMQWTWADYQPYYDDLLARDLNATTVDQWLSDWTRLLEVISEHGVRLEVMQSQDTSDKDVEARYFNFLETINEPGETYEQKMKEKLLQTGLDPAGLEIMLRNLRNEVAIFREANIPLATELQKVSTAYDNVIGAQTVQFEGQEMTTEGLKMIALDTDRNRREQAWWAATRRRVQDKDKIGELWVQAMDLRKKQADNAGEPDYRAYRWKQLHRFDYTPQDCERFHDAIEKVVVPAAVRIYERRREALKLESLRPWDLAVETTDDPPLKPFTDAAELEDGTGRIFERVDPVLGRYFSEMRELDLLDTPNRKNKAAGAYCTDYHVMKKPFIFHNAVGIHDDVQTMLHEAGHAFHVFESAQQPYIQQRDYPTEFAEVASMSMELLALPYLTKDQGGFYTQEEANRAVVEHLEGLIGFWPYMATMDAFQHWVYTHHTEATDPANCDKKWLELWGRFMKGIDTTGFSDDEHIGGSYGGSKLGWRYKLHIHRYPFYYIEYGLAQLGAAQVWRGSLPSRGGDQSRAVEQYRKALSLGGSRPLPELYATAGAKLAFDADTLGQAVDLIEETIEAM